MITNHKQLNKSLLNRFPVCCSLTKQTLRMSERGGFFNGLFWFVVMLFISFEIASLCFTPYLIVSVLTPCFPALKTVSDLLLAGVMFPYKCSDNMVNKRSYNSLLME